ncbi:MAG: hypothetical protein ABIP51_02890, partial [Bacteroidia bacterium]
NYTNAFSGNNEVNSKTNIGAKRFRSRNKTWNFFEHKKKKTSKQKKVKRFRKDNATCFHF